MNSPNPTAECISNNDASVPSVVYKYLPIKGGISSLRDMTIKFSRVEEFNDPFELMVGGIDENDMVRIAEEAFESYSNESSWKEFCGRFPYLEMDNIRREALIFGFPLDFHRFFHIAFAKARNALIESIPKRANRDMGIACFSDRFDSILMWSHYAELHKGIVIGYKTKLLPSMTPVQYSDKRYMVPLYHDKAPGWEKRLSATKFSDWSYEHEWRCLVKNEKLQSSSVGDFHVLHHEPRTIDCIYMGIHIDEALRKECECFGKYHPACKLYRATCHPTEFSLLFERLSIQSGD